MRRLKAPTLGAKGRGLSSMFTRSILALAIASCSVVLFAGSAPAATFDAGAAFGARESVSSLHMSPDGHNVVELAPGKGQGSVAYTLNLAKGSKPKPALVTDGEPYRVRGRRWVSNKRLVCTTLSLHKDPNVTLAYVSRLVAVDADG